MEIMSYPLMVDLITGTTSMGKGFDGFETSEIYQIIGIKITNKTGKNASIFIGNDTRGRNFIVNDKYDGTLNISSTFRPQNINFTFSLGLYKI